MEAQEAAVIPDEPGRGHGVAGKAASDAQVGLATSSNWNDANSLFLPGLL